MAPDANFTTAPFHKGVSVQKRILSCPDFVGKCVTIHCQVILEGKVVNGDTSDRLAATERGSTETSKKAGLHVRRCSEAKSGTTEFQMEGALGDYCKQN